MSLLNSYVDISDTYIHLFHYMTARKTQNPHEVMQFKYEFFSILFRLVVDFIYITFRFFLKLSKDEKFSETQKYQHIGILDALLNQIEKGNFKEGKQFFFSLTKKILHVLTKFIYISCYIMSRLSA